MKKELRNGVMMPKIGLGVYKMTDREETLKAITTALKVGYRAIDTASYYFNEKEVGEAIKLSGIPREEIFITTKVWNDDQGYDETLRAFEKSLKLLDLDYIDAYLTHWPVPNKFVDTYRAIERLYEEKLIRVPGVSNHHEKHLRELEKEVNIMPMVNQIELHPYLQQRELKAYCESLHIEIIAWAPICRGKPLREEILQQMAKKYDKTPAQVILKWHLQMGNIVIPKSVTPSRIKENFDIMDFTLTSEELAQIKLLDRNGRIGANPELENFMEYFERR